MRPGYDLRPGLLFTGWVCAICGESGAYLTASSASDAAEHHMRKQHPPDQNVYVPILRERFLTSAVNIECSCGAWSTTAANPAEARALWGNHAGGAKHN